LILSLPKPEPGLVIRCSYLWLDEFLAGQEEGAKDRPCAIVTAIREDADGEQRVLVLPITHRKPVNMAFAVEIPAQVKRHIGLDSETSWIVLSESNEFLWPGPDLRRIRDGDDSTVAYGFLPPKLFTIICKRFIELNERRQAVRVQRTE
jgi:hypothetical protein